MEALTRRSSVSSQYPHDCAITGPASAVLSVTDGGAAAGRRNEPLVHYSGSDGVSMHQAGLGNVGMVYLMHRVGWFQRRGRVAHRKTQGEWQ